MYRRQLVQIILAAIVGLGLTITLHACQGSSPPLPPSQSSSVSTTASVMAPREASPPAALPPNTQAIVASVPGLVNPPRGDVRLAVISDLNSAYGSTDYDPEVDKGIALLPFWQPDMVVCGGDMVAGQDPTLAEPQLKAMWDAFDQHVAAPLRAAQLPYGFTVGNHDASSALGVSGKFLFKRERDMTAQYWQDPAHDPGVKFIDKFEYPFFYTFEFQDIFFMAWDGSSNYIPEEKLAWVEAALSSEKAQQAKLRILLGHLPLYAVAIGRNEPAEVMANADTLRQMLEKNKVHTYISGHHHSYYPAHKGAMQLLHTGILGAGPRPLIDGTPPRKTITILDIRFDTPELTTYTTYDMATLAPIAFEELPRMLTGHNGMVLRRDVDEKDLSATEKAQCEGVLSPTLCAA